MRSVSKIFIKCQAIYSLHFFTRSIETSREASDFVEFRSEHLQYIRKRRALISSVKASAKFIAHRSDARAYRVSWSKSVTMNQRRDPSRSRNRNMRTRTRLDAQIARHRQTVVVVVVVVTTMISVTERRLFQHLVVCSCRITTSCTTAVMILAPCISPIFSFSSPPPPPSSSLYRGLPLVITCRFFPRLRFHE